jgi:acetolactate synthase-1/3 small subunit
MKHIIAVLLENEPGALSRVVGLFSARGYNIESLTVAPTEDPSLSRMTIQTTGSDDVIEQITKHLNRLIEVVKVVDLTEGAYIERELMMVKVRAVGKEREEMKRMADIFRGRIIDVTDKSYTIELTGDQSKNDAFLEALERAPFWRRCEPVPAALAVASVYCESDFFHRSERAFSTGGARTDLASGDQRSPFALSLSMGISPNHFLGD